MRYILSLLSISITLMGISSCSHSEKKKEKTSLNKGRAVITVNPKTLYSQLGVAEKMAARVLSENCIITDTLLVYGEDGVLVGKYGVETHRLNPVTIKTDELPGGTYTMVLWQSSHSNNNSTWVATGEKFLSTVAITTEKVGISFQRALGVGSTTVTIDGKLTKTALDTKPMGSIVEMRVDGLARQSDITQLDVYALDNWYYGVRLDPAHRGDSRWLVNSENYYANVISYLKRGQNSEYFFTLNHGDDMTLMMWAKKSDGEREYMATSEHLQLHTGGSSVYYYNIDHADWLAFYDKRSEKSLMY